MFMYTVKALHKALKMHDIMFIMFIVNSILVAPPLSSEGSHMDEAENGISMDPDDTHPDIDDSYNSRKETLTLFVLEINEQETFTETRMEHYQRHSRSRKDHV